MKELAGYFLVTLLAVGGGALLSLQFLQSASSQEGGTNSSGGSQPPSPPPPPAEGDLADDEPVEELPRLSFPKPLSSQSDTAESVREVEVFLEPFIYDSKERRNPFEPFKEKEAESGGPLGPLQKFNLEELTLLGIMWDVKNPKVMFTDPTNQVHVVGRDEGIGRKNGYIAAIREGEVVVVEAVRTETGIVYETKVLRLPR